MGIKHKLLIYTDGSIVTNKLKKNDVGSYGFIAELVAIDTETLDRVIKASTEDVILEDDYPNNTTIAVMEVKGIMHALNWVLSNTFTMKKLQIELYSDSKTTLDIISKYIPNWIAKSKLTKNPNLWLTTSGSPVANQELLKELHNLIVEVSSLYTLKLTHVKAHEVSEKNNRIDELCYNKIITYFKEI